MEPKPTAAGGTGADCRQWRMQGGGGSGLSVATAEPFRRWQSPENQRGAAPLQKLQKMRTRGRLPCNADETGRNLPQANADAFATKGSGAECPSGEPKPTAASGRGREAEVLVFQWRLPSRLGDGRALKTRGRGQRPCKKRVVGVEPLQNTPSEAFFPLQMAKKPSSAGKNAQFQELCFLFIADALK